MKLSPEAKQAIKTAIEQLRLLLSSEEALQLTKSVIRRASISNDRQSSRLMQAANFHSFKRIYAEIDKLTEEVKALRSSNKKLKKRVNTLEEWEKIHR